MRGLWAGVLLLALAIPAFGQQPVTPVQAPAKKAAKPKAKPKAKAAPVQAPQPPAAPFRTITPAEAVVLAAADISPMAEADRPFQRYYFTLDPTPEFYGAFSYSVNTALSHATLPYRPARLAGGHLLRVDLRRLWPDAGVFAKLLVVYEGLAKIDPYFHTTGEVELVREEEVIVEVPEFTHTDGKRYRARRETKRVVEKITGTEYALHLLGADEQPVALASLALATQSETPILRADWFMAKILSTLNGGLYYDFQLIEKNPGGGQTAEGAWLRQIGADIQLVRTLRADQRVGMWRSGVTGKPRSIEYFYGVGTRPSLGPGLVTLTRDYFDGRINAKKHPILNLLEHEFDGTEGIGIKSNGFLFYGLFDAAGGRVESAPSKLVSDRSIPDPHTTELQPPISCIRCHAIGEGYRDARNDILAFTRGPNALNIFDDEASKEDPISTVDRLAGLYSGDISDPLRTARNTHAKAIYTATGGMDPRPVMEKVAAVYNQYVYDAVTPVVACRELGWEVTEDQAAELFDRILPRLPKNRGGVSPETITIGTLRAWSPRTPIAVNRDDWEQVFPDAMLRVTTEAVHRQFAQEVQR